MKTYIYNNDNISVIKEELSKDNPIWNKVKGTKTHEGYSVYGSSVSFDIETTSTYIKDTKIGFMYAFAICIGNMVIFGRTTDDLLGIINILIEQYNLSINKRMVIWVHNLGFEFQFIRKLFTWDSIFALSERTPVKATTTEGIEFRCSYQLSGQSLENVAKNLISHKIEKLVGDLDYDKIRHHKTEITKDEWKYLENDVVILKYYIDEQIEQYKRITLIPMTNTGRVRKYCRKKCLTRRDKDGKIRTNNTYLKLIEGLTLDSNEYKQLKMGFQGGFTHANIINTNKVLHDVTSMDFTSSYPTVMISEQFPMSKSKIVNINNKEEFLQYLRNYCCLFDVKFTNLKQRPLVYDNPLSISKCQIDGRFGKVKDGNENNGRLIAGHEVITTLTDVDFRIIQQFYTWDYFQVSNFRIYKRGYLPKPFIEAILELYNKKTLLKGVKGSESDYLLSKGMLNSLYGMCVTDIDKETWLYDNMEEWHIDTNHNLEDSIKAYNESRSRFLFYPWGVWITAYARRNLFSGILELEDDYCYADTDSVKFLNEKDHERYFKEYNEMIKSRLYTTMDFYKLSRELVEPETIKGEKKLLGVWAFDGNYKTFKTLGAKRYMVEYSEDDRNKEDKGKIAITIAGLGKKAGAEWIKEEASKTNKSPFSIFNNNMCVPVGSTGKLTHTYIDDDREFDIIDYNGVPEHVKALSGVHLEPTSFNLSLTKEYVKLLGAYEFKMASQ